MGPKNCASESDADDEIDETPSELMQMMNPQADAQYASEDSRKAEVVSETQQEETSSERDSPGKQEGHSPEETQGGHSPEKQEETQGGHSPEETQATQEVESAGKQDGKGGEQEEKSVELPLA